MSAKIIVFTNQKGGCGKTTLSLNLAGMLSKKSQVLVVDGDPQGSATRWVASSSDDKIFPVAIMGLSNTQNKANREISKYINNYDFIIVDCPPATESSFTSSVLLVAHLVLIPIIPSPTDLWSAVGIQNLINNVIGINEKLVVRIVANMCQQHVNMSKDALKDVFSQFDFPKLQTNIFQRTAYREAALLGCCVADLKNAKAKTEMMELTKEVIKILNKFN
jgi:chromosome partitioning protein